MTTMSLSTLCARWAFRPRHIGSLPAVKRRILASSCVQCQHALFSTKRSEHVKRPKTFDSTSHRNKPVSQPSEFTLSSSDHTAPVRDWDKKNLIGLSKQQLKEELDSVAGTKSYTADQIWRFLYQRGVTSIDDMLNIPKDIKDDLKEKYTIDYGRVVVSHNVLLYERVYSYHDF